MSQARTKRRMDARITVERETGRVENVRTDLNQSEWWKGRDQIIFLITNMEPRWRANCARMLIDKAAGLYRRKRYNWFTWDVFVGMHGNGYDEMPDEVANEYLRMTDEDIRRIVRKEMDRGAHLDWMRSRPQFLALIDTQYVRDHFNLPGYAGVL